MVIRYSRRKRINTPVLGWRRLLPRTDRLGRRGGRGVIRHGRKVPGLLRCLLELPDHRAGGGRRRGLVADVDLRGRKDTAGGGNEAEGVWLRVEVDVERVELVVVLGLTAGVESWEVPLGGVRGLGRG